MLTPAQLQHQLLILYQRQELAALEKEIICCKKAILEADADCVVDYLNSYLAMVESYKVFLECKHQLEIGIFTSLIKNANLDNQASIFRV